MSLSKYDRWKTTPPDLYSCPDCGSELVTDEYGGLDCIECEWYSPGKDPDEEFDRWKDEQLENKWQLLDDDVKDW